MRIGFISDLHYDRNSYLLKTRGIEKTVKEMVSETKELIGNKGLDYLFISGDVMNTEETIDVVKELNTSRAEVYYVLGNHDLWNEGSKEGLQKRKMKVWEVYERYLKDPYCLVGKELHIKGNIYVVGMMSWYDGSFSTMGRSKEYYEQNKYGWADGKHMEWGATNEELTVQFIEEANKQLKCLKDKEVILLNHFVPQKDFVVHKSYDTNWNFGNGYMGSTKIDGLLKRNKQVKYVTFGHTHEGATEEKDGVMYIGRPLGYYHEWKYETFQEELADTLKIIDF